MGYPEGSHFEGCSKKPQNACVSTEQVILCSIKFLMTVNWVILALEMIDGYSLPDYALEATAPEFTVFV